LQYFLAFTSIFVNLSQVVIAVLGDSQDFILFDSADGMSIGKSELPKAPLRVEVSGKHSLHKTEHALSILNIIGLSWMRWHHFFLFNGVDIELFA
jgi:hypothetical protein